MRRLCLQLSSPMLLSLRRFDRIMQRRCRSCRRNFRLNLCERLDKLVEDAKGGVAAFEHQVTGKLEVSRKEAADQQVLIPQEIEQGHEHATNRLKVSHQTTLQEAKRKAFDEQNKLCQSHIQEIERLKPEHTVALAELKAASHTSHTQRRQSLADAHSILISELDSEHNRALSEAEEKFKNKCSALVDAHSRGLDRRRKGPIENAPS